MTRNDNTRTARKFTKISALVDRGATPGERGAARNVARNLITSKGLRACVPGHPLSEIVGFSWEIVEIVEAAWDFSEGRNTFAISESEKVALFAGIEAFGAKELGRAYRIIRDRLSAGWNAGDRPGEWHAGNDLKFLNIALYLFERAFANVAPLEGFEPADMKRFLAA